jgi:hypothetical protein
MKPKNTKGIREYWRVKQRELRAKKKRQKEQQREHADNQDS